MPSAWVYSASGGSINARLAVAGWSVTVVSSGNILTPAEAKAGGYDLVGIDLGYAAVSATQMTAALALFEAGVSVYTSGNDTTAAPGMFTGTSARDSTLKSVNITPVGTHPAAGSGWTHVDTDLNLYLTGIHTEAVVIAQAQVKTDGTMGPMALARKHAENNARWVHFEPYNVAQSVVAAAIRWIAARARRATDQITLTVLPAPTYVRAYYLMQDSNLPAPSVPTTNPPADPWSINEPVYQLGQDKTVYSVMLTAYGSAAFEYGPVQLSTAYKAAKDAYLAAQGAIVTANGKNRVVWSTSTPPASMAGFVAGDIWFRRNGSGSIIGQWEAVDTNGTLAWTSRSFSNEVIANLDAGKITTGTLSADRIGANSIGTNKLLISSFENLIQDPSFEYAPSSAWVTSQYAPIISSANSRTGAKVLSLASQSGAYVAAYQPAMEVKEGEHYRVGYWIRMDAAGFSPIGSGVRARFKYGPSESNLTTNSTPITVVPSDLLTDYMYISGEWVVPEGARYARFEFVQHDTSADARVYLVDDVEIFKMLTGELIVDGIIKGIKIAADEITSLHLQALSVSAKHIQANSIFADMIGANEIKGKHIAFQTIEGNMIKTGTLEVSHVSPTFGQDLIISGNVSIISAVAAANSAQSSATAVAGNVATMQTYYTFGPDGAYIKNPATVFATAVRSDRIEMIENGNVISYWNSGTLYVNQLQASRVTLASHQLEAFGTDGTVVRSLG